MAKIPWMAQVRNARNSAEQIVALRTLKNDIIGHPLKKELAVNQGVLDPVVRLIFNKSSLNQNGKAHDHSFAPRALVDEEMVRLQGIQIVASLALGGPPFLGPLQSSSALPAILSNLCPVSNPWQLVLASLRALSNLADSSTLASNTQALSISTIAEVLFSRWHLSSLCRVLSQTSLASHIQNQISIAASLISRLCQEERHQQGLANSGVLDALATKLASFVVAEGFVIPGAELLAQRDGMQEYFPPPAPPNANLSIILEAIAVIIADSKYRAAQLLYSPSILATLPISQPIEFNASSSARAALNAFNAAGLGAGKSQLNSLNAIDYLLPWAPLPQLRIASAQASAFPPLGSSGSRENLALNGNSGRHRYGSTSLPSWNESLGEGLAPQETAISESEEPDSPLISYLILLVRTRGGLTRLMAASVLTHLYRTCLALKNRENSIALLVVPVLVNMLDDGIAPLPKGKDSYAEDEALLLDRVIKERAPAVLAMLITDSEILQKAAFDAGVVSKLSKMLKVSYDPVSDSSRPQPWSPQSDQASGDFDVQSPRLGRDEGQPLSLLHKIKVREATLKAIAALVPFKDEYRKAIVDQGMMPYIVESMSSNPSKPSPRSTEKSEKMSLSSDDEPNQGYGVNPVSVLIAACVAVRALSRSISVLRTTLIDNGVADPVFNLLRHPDIEVQIAATACVCNLLTDVSPMRERFQEAGVLKILCEHAHSMNAKLRLNALWALKHFVHGVDNEMKRQCVEELGQGWLVQLICDDTENQALNTSSANSDRVHTPIEDTNEDVEMDQFEEQVETAFGTSFGRYNSRPSSSRSKSVQQAEVRIAALRDEETNPLRKARKDDIAVQEQGLDFIRNLIGGAGQGGTETDMIDFLFQSLGQDRVFEILISKLKPKVINPYNRRRSSSPDTRIIPPQAEIIIAVAYILVHMAASVPRHRQLVIAQTDLLKLLVPQFNHSSIEVRLALCWLCTNLTWLDDTNDGPACKQRTAELRKLGFLSKLEMLEQDPELNVRERAKSALWQMKADYRE